RDDVYEVLDLCLECRACKAECPVGVDVGRFKSEFLADYWNEHGTPLGVKAIGRIHSLLEFGSRMPSFANAFLRSAPSRWLAAGLLGIDRRRPFPTLAATPFSRALPHPAPAPGTPLIFADTFTNFCRPDIGIAAADVLSAAGIVSGIAPNVCCGRPLISKGLLAEARALAQQNTDALHAAAAGRQMIVFLEPSCLSAVREDAPSLLRGEAQRRAQTVARACVLFEDFLEEQLRLGAVSLALSKGPGSILLHGHCHQKAMGLLPSA